MIGKYYACIISWLGSVTVRRLDLR